MKIELTEEERNYLLGICIREGRRVLFGELLSSLAISETDRLNIISIINKLNYIDEKSIGKCNNGHYHKGKVVDNEGCWSCEVCGALIKPFESCKIFEENEDEN